MELTTYTTHNRRMSEHTKQTLRDTAFDLACQAFGDPYDEAVEAIYERLVWNYWRGLGEDGAITVH